MMGPFTLELKDAFGRVGEDQLLAYISENAGIIDAVRRARPGDSESLGWSDIAACADERLVREIEALADEIRRDCDVFVVIGVGGSNGASRAAIEALKSGLPGKNPQIVYMGNTLSPNYLKNALKQLEGKSVYANVIAKNFATLEPGVSFRLIRDFLEKTYGREQAARRMIATGSPKSSLELLSARSGYRFLPFQLDVGGRYSALTAVGLLPMAVAGIDIRALIRGASDMEKRLKTEPYTQNPAVRYAAARNLLHQSGYQVELLCHFEPAFYNFGKWWLQLFEESEGKDGKGLFASTCSFSEDLHSMGQYIQDGQPILFETFLSLKDQGDPLPLPSAQDDGFAYLNGRDFAFLNDAAFRATVAAHSGGRVPCLVLELDKLSAYAFGQLFYFFEYACFLSGSLLGVDPFDQPGVEAYKKHMFKILGKE